MDVRLPDIPRIAVQLIQTDIEQVEAYFRGKYLDLKLNSIEIQGEDPQPYSILRGSEAGAENQFQHPGEIPYLKYAWVRERFKTWGLHRISRPRSNPEFVMIEGNGNLTQFFVSDHMAQAFDQPVYTFFSAIGWDDFDAHLYSPEFKLPKGELFTHEFSAKRGTKLRDVLAIHDEGRYQFRQTGEPEWFERIEHYECRKIKDRLNRNVICEYLERMGIDPEGTFERRELDDAVLFTIDEFGEPLDGFTEDLEKFRAIELPGPKVTFLAPGEKPPPK